MTGQAQTLRPPGLRRGWPIIALVALPLPALAQVVPAAPSFWQRFQMPLLLGGLTVLFALLLGGLIVWGRRRLATAEGDAVDIELRWTDALDAAGLGVWDWRPDTDTVVYSDQWARLLDHQPEEIRGRLDDWRERLHPQDREQALADLDRHLNGALGSYRHLQRLRTKGGSWRWFLNRAAIMDRGEDGTPLRIVGTLTDMTRCKSTEETLRAQEALFSAVFMPARDGIVLIDPASLGLVLYNDAAARGLGYSRAELGKLRLTDIEDAEPKAVLTRLKALMKAGGGDYQAHHRHKDGTPRQVHCLARVIPSGGKRLLAAIWADDTERAWAAAALREAETRFRVTFEQSAVGMAHATPDGRLLRVNHCLCQLLGRGRKALVEQPLEALIHPEDRAADAERRQQLIGRAITSYQAELRLLDADQQSRWAGLTAALVRKTDGTPDYFVLVIEDIAARRKSQAALQSAKTHFRALLENTSDGVLVLRSGGTGDGLRIIAANAAASTMLDTPATQLIAKPLDEAVPAIGTSDLMPAIRRVALSGERESPPPLQLQCGASRCSIESRIYRLPSAEIVVSLADRTELEQGRAALAVARRRLDELASHDRLTGLPNRTLLLDRIGQAAAAVDADGAKLAVCFLDLDGFRRINEQHGTALGDRLIKAVAERLQAHIPAPDTIARWGGDEMGLLLTGLDGVTAAEERLAHLLRTIAAPYQLDAQALEITACIGLTLYPDDDGDPDTLLRHANQALYAAKQRGADNWSFFDTEADGIACAHRQRLGQIDASLEQDELRLMFQPIVDMRAGRVVALEALLRWDHPDEGLLLPATFLPTAEGSHLMRRLDLWMLDHALPQLHNWVEAGQTVGLNVNISAYSLTSEGFADVLGMLLAAYPIVPPERITIEVPESMALNELDQVVEVLKRIRSLGVHIALDDFGTGWSSLTYFRRLPVDRVKIDCSFIHNMLDDEENLSIVRAVTDLAGAFHRSPIAEGIETEAQGSRLIALGCHLAQGFAIAEPMPAEGLMDWIRDWQPPARWRNAMDGPAVAPSDPAPTGG